MKLTTLAATFLRWKKFTFCAFYSKRLLRLNPLVWMQPCHCVSCLCCGSQGCALLSLAALSFSLVFLFVGLFVSSLLPSAAAAVPVKLLRPFFNAVPLSLSLSILPNLAGSFAALSCFSLLQDVWLCAWVFDKPQTKAYQVIKFLLYQDYFQTLKQNEVKLKAMVNSSIFI